MKPCDLEQDTCPKKDMSQKQIAATSDPSLLILCDNLRRLRAAHGLSKKQMAKILGTSTHTLTKLENDIIPSRLGSHVLFRASQHFKISAHELLCFPD